MSALPCKYLPMYPQKREKLSINTLFEKVLVLDFKPTLRALTFLQFKIERKPFECSFCVTQMEFVCKLTLCNILTGAKGKKFSVPF